MIRDSERWVADCSALALAPSSVVWQGAEAERLSVHLVGAQSAPALAP